MVIWTLQQPNLSKLEHSYTINTKTPLGHLKYTRKRTRFTRNYTNHATLCHLNLIGCSECLLFSLPSFFMLCKFVHSIVLVLVVVGYCAAAMLEDFQASAFTKAKAVC